MSELLYIKSGEDLKESGLRFCKSCRYVFKVEQYFKCPFCICNKKGCDTNLPRKGRSYCEEHEKARVAQIPKSRFKKGRKFHWSNYTKPVWDEHGKGNSNDGLYISVDELMEAYDDQVEGDEDYCEMPLFCYGSDVEKFELDCSKFLENELEEHFEDAYDQVVDEDELQDFIEKWNAKQTIETYHIRYEDIVILGTVPKFLDLYLEDKLKFEDIDDFIEIWHSMYKDKGAEYPPLHDFLGMTSEQYDRWLQEPRYLLVLKQEASNGSNNAGEDRRTDCLPGL